MTDRPAPSVPTSPPAPTGPGAFLRRLCERFDRLFSLDHSPARKASDEYDEAFHDAVHALKDLRQFAQVIAPTWQGAAELPQIEGLIEEAIKLAASLGEDAFDYIEGRGLYQMRLDIRSALRRISGGSLEETEK